ncbi:membrane protein insertion efficiency factor YidD [Georgenia sp. EYE_87]|uniref:membrane protein insertion efficiency factor YidD n=1 Tax=Georgenia sp. EYE_87 TaxID=2853448 RepID=UPI002006C1C2|nr:membrane protein insertion efficiency factor YidD [Georgenia sp. EYE_87]MCK6210372.1 membrane protein insertion efficiency factor YidD [Georgenia sp. EYE_87]
MTDEGSERRASSPSTGEDVRPRNPLTWLLLGLVRVYQAVVSPWLPPSCKYYPSCSAYAVTALRRHGALKGTALAGWRLLRCNPWSRGGVDHVPPRGRWSNTPAEVTDADVGQQSSDEGVETRTLGADTRGARTIAPQDR